MAVAPTAAPAPTDDMAAAEPAMETSGMGDNEAAEGEGDMGGWMPVATILKNEAGEFMLVQGDEPDDGSEPEGPTFKDGPSLLRAVMETVEGQGDADKAFGEGYQDRARKPPMMTKPMA